MSIGYAISTVPSYRDIAASRCIESLLKAGVPGDDILLFTGGNSDGPVQIENWKTYDCMEYIVPYEAFEYTALIAATEMPVIHSHIFLLHDTCEVLPGFKEIIERDTDLSFDLNVINNGICNFGMYSMEFLQRPRVKNILQAMKGMSKKDAIDCEGQFFRQGVGSGVNYPDMGVSIDPFYRDVYNTGTPRIVEYYLAGYLIKYKANHGQTSPGSYIVRP